MNFEEYWSAAALLSVGIPNKYYEQVKVACKLSFEAGQCSRPPGEEKRCAWREDEEGSCWPQCKGDEGKEVNFCSNQRYKFFPRPG